MSGRIVRHWKQKFDANAPLIFLRATELEGGVVQAGGDVPESLRSQSARMKIWWNGNRVALKNWDYDKGEPAVAVDSYTDLGGAWFLFPDGEKVHGAKALEAKLASLV